MALAVSALVAVSSFDASAASSAASSTGSNRTAAPAFTAAEQAYVTQMQNVIFVSRAKGALNNTSMSRVFKEAHNAGVKPEVVGQMVSDLVTAYPDSVSRIVSAAIAPTGGTPSKQLVWNVMNSAIMSSPRPFTTALLVRDTMLKSVDSSKLAGIDDYIKATAVQIASNTPDDPLKAGVITLKGKNKNYDLPDPVDAPVNEAWRDLVLGGAGYGALFLDPEIGINPFTYVIPPPPVSNPNGPRR